MLNCVKSVILKNKNTELKNMSVYCCLDFFYYKRCDRE